jgi:antitoxin HicB
MKFRVTIEPDEDGIFVAQCPALPGCISQGKTYEEAMTNIRDAIQGYLESLKKHGEGIPSPITEAIVEVPVWAVFRFVQVQMPSKHSPQLDMRWIIKPAVTPFSVIPQGVGSAFPIIVNGQRNAVRLDSQGGRA